VLNLLDSFSMFGHGFEVTLSLCPMRGDKAKAQDAIQHALSLNPDSPWIKNAASSLN